MGTRYTIPIQPCQGNRVVATITLLDLTLMVGRKHGKIHRRLAPDPTPTLKLCLLTVIQDEITGFNKFCENEFPLIWT